MLVFYGLEPPGVISILDCTLYMVSKGRKDAEITMGYFKEKWTTFTHQPSIQFDSSTMSPQMLNKHVLIMHTFSLSHMIPSW